MAGAGPRVRVVTPSAAGFPPNPEEARAAGRRGSGGDPGHDMQSPPDPDRAPDARRVDAEADDEVRLVYAPERDGEPDPGEVVWAWVPYEEDPSQGKDRPVVVVGVAGADLAVVPLSSRDHGRRRDRDEWMELGTGAWDREGRVSYVDLDRLLLVDPGDVRREGSILDPVRFERVVDAVAEWHGLEPPEMPGRTDA